MVEGTRFISVIMPCREEEKYIAKALASILANDYPRERLEVLVVDGMSTDRTREIVADFARNHSCIRLLDNPRRITPAALNIGIAQAQGDIIVRVDAHSTYPPNYLSSLVAWQEKTGADNVGGIWRILPGSDNPLAQAIAIGLAHPFGVGNAHYRIGAAEPRWVDTVPFGAYRREVFDRIGLFDEDQVRTEDDEFNLRLRKSGGRSLLVPEIVIDYYARESLAKLWRMYYYYGYFKPLVARKLGLVLSLRHVIPSLFLLTLALSGIAGWWVPGLGRLGFLALVAYILADIGFAGTAGWRPGLAVAAWLALVFPTLHFSYGLGFLKGFLDFYILRKKTARGGKGVPLAR
jgi:glycosyltransferase involved in cell wall biosynthesis